MKSFSVLTVSKRTGWEKPSHRSVQHQTAHPREWVVIVEEPTKYQLGLPYSNPVTHVRYDDPPIAVSAAPSKTKLSNLNASLNAGLRRIDTDYVIFYQDFIELPPDCFEKLLQLADERTFVTTCTPNYDGSDDSRYTGVDAPRACRPEEWETNVAIAPMAFLRDKLGGFEEEYDWGWSWDNVNVACRAAMLGAKFIIDESNRPKLYPHEMSSHETLPLNLDRHNAIMHDIRTGARPIKNKYL